MPPISLTSIVAARSQQVSADLQGEAVILDLERGRYYGLNEVGARIWSLVQQPRAVSEIRDCILREYAVEAERCEADLIALLRQLVEKQLLEIIEPPAGWKLPDRPS